MSKMVMLREEQSITIEQHKLGVPFVIMDGIMHNHKCFVGQ